MLVYLSDQLRKFSFRNFGFIERGQFLSTKRSVFIYPYRLMVEGDYFFIDKKIIDLAKTKLLTTCKLSKNQIIIESDSIDSFNCFS